MKKFWNKFIELNKKFWPKFKKKDTLIAIAIIAVGIFIDQLTKCIAKNCLEYGNSKTIINNFFELTYIRNKGAAWGMFQDSYVFLGIITLIAMAAFIYLLSDINYKNSMLYSISIPLMISGTIGNLIDRTARALFNGEGVIDFLDFEIFGYDFPVFNIADVLLVVGVILFAVHLIFFSEKFKEKGDNNETRDDSQGEN